MKEMLLGLGGDYYYVTVSEKAIERLPQEYQKRRDSFFKTVTLHHDECIDARVIALAKEMGEEFYDHSERKGFKIISYDETKVIPVFMEVGYEGGWGEEKLYFIAVEDADEWQVEQGFIHSYCDEEYLLKNGYPYDFIDYDETEILVVENKKNIPSKNLFNETDKTNVLPYFTLPQGNSWVSCHNIDK